MECFYVEKLQEQEKILTDQINQMVDDHNDNPWAVFQYGATQNEMYTLAMKEGIDAVREYLHRDSIKAYHAEEAASGNI